MLEKIGINWLKNPVLIGLLLMILFVQGSIHPLVGANADEAHPVVTQVSSLQALVEGKYTNGLPVDHFKEYGDFGLGTFDYVDGEMIQLDGTIYRADHEGNLKPARSDRYTPFAVTHPFEAGKNRVLRSVDTFEELEQALSEWVPEDFSVHAFLIEGTFQRLVVRSVPRQSEPGVPLEDVIDQEQIFEWDEVEASLVGYRFPPYMAGVNVPGYHFHVVSEDRERGGHLYDLSLQQAEVFHQRLDELSILRLNAGGSSE